MSDIYFNSPANGTNVRVFTFKQRVLSTVLSFFWHRMPILTRKVLTRLFMATDSYALSEEESACLDRGRPLRIQVHDKSIQAWQWGQGPGILLIHGWNGRGAQFHKFVEPIIQAGYSAIAIDGPGHGRSGGRTTSYFELTDVVRAFLSPGQGLNIQAVIGHSFGAAAVINSLEKDNLNLRTVCIAPVIRLRELLLNTFHRFGVPSEIPTAIIGDFEARFGYNLIEDNPPRLIGRLTAPVLIIHDAEDRTAPYTDAREQVRAHSHVALHTTHGLGHRRILSDAGVIRAALRHIGPVLDEDFETASNYQTRRSAMNLSQSILEQYAAAEEDQRLGLYLIHRHLREDFMKIDLEESARTAPQKSPTPTSACLGSFHKCCLGWLKPAA